MFKLIRRISSSVYQRPDRPWSDDATSNAPTIGRKRRMSDEDDDSAQDEGSVRKRRGQLQREDTEELGELGVKSKEPDAGLKEVTRGVKEVELEDKKDGEDEEAKEVKDGKDATEEKVEEALESKTEEPKETEPKENEVTETEAAEGPTVTTSEPSSANLVDKKEEPAPKEEPALVDGSESKDADAETEGATALPAPTPTSEDTNITTAKEIPPVEKGAVSGRRADKKKRSAKAAAKE